jgi:diguanylate cyclase
MMQIVRDLFVNLSIMTSLIMFFNMLMPEKLYISSLRNSLLNGLASGLLGCLLMVFSVSITSEVILDFRYIPIILMAIYNSPLAAIESSIVMAAFRVAFFGFNRGSLTAVVVILLIGLGCAAIGSLRLRLKLRWLLSVVCVCVISGIGIWLITSELADQGKILLVYLSGLTGVSVMMFFFIEFISKFNRNLDRIKKEAEQDFLTGLHNSRYLEKALNSQREAAVSEMRNMALLYIDIDHFKQINDQFGHAGGDQVLVELSAILRKMARSMDIVTRKGGEEFTMLLTDCPLEKAVDVAERIRKSVEAHEFQLSQHNRAKITVSIGVAAIPETTDAEDKLLDHADAAMYRAKQAGRNRVVMAG